MSVDVGAIRVAMAEALEAVGDVEVSPYVRSQPTPPGLQILPPEVQYDASFARGLDVWFVTIQGFVALVDDISPQMLLDQMLTPDGVKAALEADKTLGGLVHNLRVESSGPPRQVESSAGYPMLLVEWRVSMYVPGR